MAMALIGIGRSHPSADIRPRPRRTATFKALLGCYKLVNVATVHGSEGITKSCGQ